MNGSSTVCFTSNYCSQMLEDVTYHRPLLDIERNFDSCDAFTWCQNNRHFGNGVIVVYLVAIFAGQRYMKSRPPFQLYGALLAWNAALALFNIWSAWRTATALFYQVQHDGFYMALCGGGSLQYQRAIGLHLVNIGLCKIVDLGDTVFLVLRKKPLNFLHWFHHATVCYLAWSSCSYPSGLYVFFMVANYFVHSFVYSYFALKLLNIRIPLIVNKVITSLQLLEMFSAVSITLYAYRMKTSGFVCCVHDGSITICASIYTLYFFLFLNFFIRSYFFSKPLPGGLSKKKRH